MEKLLQMIKKKKKNGLQTCVRDFLLKDSLQLANQLRLIAKTLSINNFI